MILSCIYDTETEGTLFLCNLRGVFLTPKRKFSLLLELCANNLFSIRPNTHNLKFVHDWNGILHTFAIKIKLQMKKKILK